MLTFYAMKLWLQTLAALLALGVCGGWVLQPFRRPDRPYLWLAAPLAGVPILALALTLLFHVFRLSVPLALSLALLLTATPSGIYFVRWLRRSPGLPGWKAAVLTLGAASVWATFACNRTALIAGEPTISLCEGSDQWGYSSTANWMLRHQGELPVYQPDHPSEAFTYQMLAHGDARPGAFLLTAAAAVVRGTTAIFSYDWICGVVLGAGLAGLAGLFASRRLSLLLLLATGILSAWLAISRTGYLGKLLAYPAFLLLSFLFLAAWARPSALNLVITFLVSWGAGLCLSPMATLYVLALPFGGMLLALTVSRLRRPEEVGTDPALAGRPLWRSAVVGTLLFALVTILPHRIQTWLFVTTGPQIPPLEWSRLVTIVLDLDNPGVAFVGVPLGLKLAGVALLLDVVFLALAYRQRDTTAAAYLLCVGLIPVAWFLGQKAVFAFHGILFPMTAIGAVLVLQNLHPSTAPALRRFGVAVLAVGLLALRVPQFTPTCARYLAVSPTSVCSFFKRSEVASIRRIIGDRGVDVRLSDVHSAALVWDELAGRGVRVQFSEPTWSRLFCWTGWKPPAHQENEFILRPRSLRGPTEGVPFANRRFELVEAKGVLLTDLQPAHGLEQDGRGLFFWQGRTPSTIEISNRTERPAKIILTADCEAGPGNADLDRRTVRATCGDWTATQVLNQENGWRLSIPLLVSPGTQSLTLRVEEPATVSIPGDPRDLLLLIANVRLEEPVEHPETPRVGSGSAAPPPSEGNQ
jgi:hypothetical protein